MNSRVFTSHFKFNWNNRIFFLASIFTLCTTHTDFIFSWLWNNIFFHFFGQTSPCLIAFPKMHNKRQNVRLLNSYFLLYVLTSMKTLQRRQLLAFCSECLQLAKVSWKHLVLKSLKVGHWHCPIPKMIIYRYHLRFLSEQGRRCINKWWVIVLLIFNCGCMQEWFLWKESEV